MRGAHPAPLHLAQEPVADELLSRDPFALLIGMLLDQQFPMERAFAGPALIAQRMGVSTLDPAQVRAVPAAEFTAIMTGPPAVHRYPASMGERIQAVADHVVEVYGGDTPSLWGDAADGRDLMARLQALPGFGAQKSKIFISLLAKQRGIAPLGWEKVAGDYALPGYRSVADVVDPQSLQRVRDHKKEMKARAKQSPASN